MSQGLEGELGRTQIWPQRDDGSRKRSLERPLLEPVRVIPRSLKIVDDHLVWSHGPFKKEVRTRGDVELITFKATEVPRTVSSDDGVLWQFLRVATIRESRLPQAVLDYARQYGPLTTCDEHGFPACPLRQEAGCRMGRENLAHWQVWARHLASLLTIGTELLRERGKGSIQAWTVVVNTESHLIGSFAGPSALFQNAPLLDPPLMFSSKRFTEVHTREWLGDHSDEEVREEFSRRVNDLLEIGQVRPKLVWRESARVELTGRGLFGALVRQLVYALGRVDGLAQCAGCGHTFVPSRRPRRDQNSWCAQCKGAGRDNLQHQHDYRRRKAEEEEETR